MYRIAFFGSDLFSLASLKAVYALQSARPDLIESLTVTTRQLKPSGRGMKNIAQPPIVEFARDKNLPWLEIESHSDFAQLAGITNLAIAVSFGNLIPASYLKGLTYGGLNVHPSLLPQYRGAAPLQRAIMDRQSFTGVTVQSLHPTKFDHGNVLWQSSPVALEPRETTATLGQRLAELGAAGLVGLLKRGISEETQSPATPALDGTRAPIIQRQEYKIDFAESAASTDAKGRALGKLWFEQKVQQKRTKSGKLKGHPVLRVNISGFVPIASTESTLDDCSVGMACRGRDPQGNPILALRVSDGFVGASEITVAGSKPETAGDYFSQLVRRQLKEIVVS